MHDLIILTTEDDEDGQDGQDDEPWIPDPPWLIAAYSAVFTILTCLLAYATCDALRPISER
jgi:hypothetical protein